jgi:branched-chain amino acid transport system substrate-binding protein
MVEKDKVVAFLQMDAVLTGHASVDYLKSRNIPVISSEGGSNWFYGNANYFPVFSSGDPTLKGFFAGIAEVAKEAGLTKVGTLNCIEASICSAVYTKAPGYAREFAVNLVYRGQASLVQPDFTSACQSAKDAGVQVLGVALDGNSFLRLVKSCRSVGFTPRYVGQGLGLTAEIPKDPNTEGAQFSLQTIPWLETDNAIVAESEEVIRKYAPGLQPGPLTIAGYVAAKVFERTVEGTDDPTTSAGILAGLRTIRDYDVGGTTYPLTFTSEPATMRWCVWTVRVEGGKWVSDGPKAAACGEGG